MFPSGFAYPNENPVTFRLVIDFYRHRCFADKLRPAKSLRFPSLSFRKVRFFACLHHAAFLRNPAKRRSSAHLSTYLRLLYCSRFHAPFARPVPSLLILLFPAQTARPTPPLLDSLQPEQAAAAPPAPCPSATASPPSPAAADTLRQPALLHPPPARTAAPARSIQADISVYEQIWLAWLEHVYYRRIVAQMQ